MSYVSIFLVQQFVGVNIIQGQHDIPGQSVQQNNDSPSIYTQPPRRSVLLIILTENQLNAYSVSDKAAQALPFGEVFNVSALRSTLQLPLLEWRDVKHLPSLSVAKPTTGDLEQIGCWSTSKNTDQHPWSSERMLHHLHLDAAYTRVPLTTRTNPKNPGDDFVILPELLPYIFPTGLVKINEKVFKVSKANISSPPDQHLACFDLLYYTSSTRKQFEWEQVWSPMWRFVGRHVQFTDRLQSLAKEYIARALNCDSTDDMPPVSVTWTNLYRLPDALF